MKFSNDILKRVNECFKSDEKANEVIDSFEALKDQMNARESLGAFGPPGFGY